MNSSAKKKVWHKNATELDAYLFLISGVNCNCQNLNEDEHDVIWPWFKNDTNTMIYESVKYSLRKGWVFLSARNKNKWQTKNEACEILHDVSFVLWTPRECYTMSKLVFPFKKEE